MDVQAAIFRGQSGAAVYSFGNDVLINGSPATIHWLTTGDRIDFDETISAIVEELGSLTETDARIEQQIRAAEQEARLQNAIQSFSPVADVETPIQEEIETTPAPVFEAPLAAPSDAGSADLNWNQSIDLGHAAINQPETGHSIQESPQAAADPVPASDTSEASVVEQNADAPIQPFAADPIPANQPENDENSASLLPQSLQPDTPDYATESVGKQFDSLTHSQLADGSSHLNQAAEGTDPPQLNGLDQLHSISEQIKAELAAESPQQELDQPVLPQPTPETATPEAIPSAESGVDESIAQIMARVANSEPELEATVDRPTGDQPSNYEAFIQQTVAESQADLESLAAHEQTPAVDSPAEVEPEPENVAVPQPAESVSELLERMKSEGQWSGIPEGDDANVEPVTEPVAAPPEPEFAAESVPDNEETSVEDYMAQLLNRMRGDGSVPKPAQAAKPKPAVKPEAPAKPQVDPDAFVPPENPLKPEEFVPQKRAEPLKSFGAMRELANSTTRTAIKHSELSRRKALGTAQIAIGIASFAMALYYLLLGSNGIGDFQFFVGVACLLIAGFLAWRFYTTMVHNEKVDAEERRLTAAKQALDAGVPPEQVVAEYEQQLVEAEA